MEKRKICVVTGTRADYGLLYWLMKEIAADESLQLQTIVTGMHLSPEFGLTYRVMEADGFPIDEKVEMLLSSDTPVGIAKSIGLATIGFADALNRLQPDVMVVLGDRYEILAAVQAALIARIPVAHLHGGELTEGAVDESIRHAVTKMSHLHYTAAEAYRQRVIQLGEAPERVLNFGAPGLDQITRLQLLSRAEFEQSIRFALGQTNFLVTYHPVTLQAGGSEAAMRELMRALDRFPEAKILFTKPNSDTEGRIIGQMIDQYAADAPERVFVATSLGQLRYLSAIAHCDLVVGNSSSGLYEVPLFHKPTINIGDRQRGRLRPASVIDCASSADAVAAAIERGLSASFQQTLAGISSPFGDGNASVKIKEHLKHVRLEGILQKSFYEVKR